ncbi:MAG: VOC family protein [Terracidiphilus sp.]
MKRNRSIPAATVIPVLIYPDVREAVAWLSAAFGFEERVQIGENHRSQMKVGDGAVILGDVRRDRTPPRAGEVTHSVIVRVEDVRSHYERAKAHGAEIIDELTDFPFGERQYSAKDFAGHQWTFSETLNDVAPEEWGGKSINAE